MAKRLNSHLKKKELNQLQKVLETKAQEIIHSQQIDHSEIDVTTEQKDQVDAANDNLILAENLRFKTRESFYLKKINKALKRFEDDSYGVCEDCEAPITYQRLLARPTSELCIQCKEDAEQEEVHNVHLKKSQSLGTTTLLESTAN